MRTVYYGDDWLEDSEEAPADSSRVEPILEVPDPWPMLPGLVSREVDSRTGLLASPWCPEDRRYTEIYIPGTEPTEPCDETTSIFGGR